MVPVSKEKSIKLGACDFGSKWFDDSEGGAWEGKLGEADED